MLLLFLSRTLPFPGAQQTNPAALKYAQWRKHLHSRPNTQPCNSWLGLSLPQMRGWEVPRPGACLEIIPAVDRADLASDPGSDPGSLPLLQQRQVPEILPRQNSTLEPGRNWSSGYKDSLQPVILVLLQCGSSAAPLVPVGAGACWGHWADGCACVKVSCEVVPALEKLEKNSKECAHHFNIELILSPSLQQLN